MATFYSGNVPEKDMYRHYARHYAAMKNRQRSEFAGKEVISRTWSPSWGTIKTGTGMLAKILGFCIVLILFQQLMNVNSTTSAMLTLDGFLNVLSRVPAPREIPGFKEVVAAFIYFTDKGSKLWVIGPLLKAIGQTGLMLVQPIGWILQGLYMIIFLAFWIVSALFPDLMFLFM